MDEIIECKVGNSKIAILRCSEDTPNPKLHMDTLVLNYVGEEPFNSFVAKELNNPYVRVVIRGINDLDWIEIRDRCPLQAFSSVDGPIRFILFLYPPFEANTIEQLNSLADMCRERDSSCTEYVDSHLDNPFIRLIIRGYDTLHFQEFTNQRLSE